MFKKPVFGQLFLTLIVLSFSFQAEAKRIPPEEFCGIPNIPEGADRIVLEGIEDEDGYKTEIGSTESFLSSRNSRYFINLHNGNPIIEQKVCGVNYVADEGPRIKGFMLTTPEHYRGEMGGVFAKEGWFIEDLPILMNDPAINNRLWSYEEDPINETTLNSIIRDVIVFMRDKNQPVVDVYFPEQDITDGFIVALVSRAVLDKTIVNGNEYYDEDEIKKFFRLERGDYVWSDILSQDMRWINSYPYRQVDTIFKPGVQPRTTDVILETKDIYPFRVFGGVDNYGSSAVGQNQFFAGFSYGDLWDLDHELIYSFGSTFDVANFNSHNLQYKIPFDWRHKLNISGTISTSEPKTSTGPISQEGTNYFLNFDYEMPLYDWGFRGFTQTLRVGTDYKRLENNIDFGGTNVFSSEPEIVQFYITYEGSKTSAKTLDVLSVSAYGAPGDIMGNNTDEDFRTARAGSSASYAYLKGSYETKYTFDHGFSVGGLFRGQISNVRLLSSEQLAINGPGSVRGFNTNSIRRDNGFLATLEVATPFVPVLDELLQTDIRERMQGFIFVDKGYGENVSDSLATGETAIDLDSFGVGVRFGLGRHLSGVVEYGHEIEDEQSNGYDQRLHFRVNAAY